MEALVGSRPRVTIFLDQLLSRCWPDIVLIDIWPARLWLSTLTRIVVLAWNSISLYTVYKYNSRLLTSSLLWVVCTFFTHLNDVRLFKRCSRAWLYQWRASLKIVYHVCWDVHEVHCFWIGFGNEALFNQSGALMASTL